MKAIVVNEAHLLFPPFRIDPGNAQLWRGEEEISLRRKSFDVLRYLIDHPGELVTKAMLLEAIWAGVNVSDSMPANCVAEIRRALGDDANTPRFIQTVHRRGYRFIAQVMTETVREPPFKPEKPSTVPSTIMVGREKELALLRNRYAQVVDERRAVVFVAGEPGI